MDETDTGHTRGQKHRSLASGIAPTDDDYLLARARSSLQLRRCIVETCSLEPLLLSHRKLSVAGSGSNHHRPPQENGVVLERDLIAAETGVGLKLLGAARHDDARAELQRLQLGPEGEIGA